MILQSMLKELDYTILQGNPLTEITDLVYDSRKVTPGSLFICITGSVSDGHAYVPQVIEKGAAAILVEHPVEAPENVTVIQTPDTRYAMAFISAAAWMYASSGM